jgi:Zn-dependent protease/CBS domain-containing protein
LVPKRGLRLGRIFGIEVYVHWTWLIVFSLLLWATITFFRDNGKADSFFMIPTAVLTTLLFFASVLAHEVSHSLVANRNDVPIGRITLFVFGGVAQMSRDVDTPRTELKMAAAGPMASYLLAICFGSLAYLADTLGMGTLNLGLIWLALVNVGLGTFNLMPGFPLDGGRILRSIIWHHTGDLERATRLASRAGMGLGILLAAGGASLLAADPLVPGSSLMVPGVWFVLIGVFLYSAASSGYRQARMRSRTAGLQVGGFFRPGVPAVDVSTSLEEVFRLHFAQNPRAAVPVLRQGRLYGVIYYFMMAKIPRGRLQDLPAESVARQVKASETARPAESLYSALMRMEKGRLPFLWVVEDGRLLGVLLLRDLQGLVNGVPAAPS